jgi:hypothetical protein
MIIQYTQDEEKAIFNYTQESPPSINMVLRNEIKIKSKKELNEYLNFLNAFNKNKTDEDRILYRGVDINIDFNDNYITNLGFISTSDEKVCALHFSSDYDKVLLQINVPCDTPVINIGDIDIKYHQYFLEYDGGEEIFLPGRFKIIDFVNKFESKGFNYLGEEQFDENKPYTLIICDYEQLEAIEDTLYRLYNQIDFLEDDIEMNTGQYHGFFYKKFFDDMECDILKHILKYDKEITLPVVKICKYGFYTEIGERIDKETNFTIRQKMELIKRLHEIDVYHNYHKYYNFLLYKGEVKIINFGLSFLTYDDKWLELLYENILVNDGEIITSKNEAFKHELYKFISYINC